MLFALAPAPVIAQAPGCYYPQSPRVCQVVTAAPEVAQPPVVVPDTATAAVPAEEVGRNLWPLAALPLIGIPIGLVAASGGDDSDGGGVSPGGPIDPGGPINPGNPNNPGNPGNPNNPGNPGNPTPVPAPIVLPGLLLGAGCLWAAKRHRATLMVMPLFFIPLAQNPPATTAPGAQEMVFPMISENQITVNYGGRTVSLPAPMNMPRDTSKYRYFAQAREGGRWQLCWEEIKPQICPPRSAPRRLLGQSQG
jgi:hypothetical protein